MSLWFALGWITVWTVLGGLWLIALTPRRKASEPGNGLIGGVPIWIWHREAAKLERARIEGAGMK